MPLLPIFRENQRNISRLAIDSSPSNNCRQFYQHTTERCHTSHPSQPFYVRKELNEIKIKPERMYHSIITDQCTPFFIKYFWGYPKYAERWRFEGHSAQQKLWCAVKECQHSEHLAMKEVCLWINNHAFISLARNNSVFHHASKSSFSSTTADGQMSKSALQ